MFLRVVQFGLFLVFCLCEWCGILNCMEQRGYAFGTRVKSVFASIWQKWSGYVSLKASFSGIVRRVERAQRPLWLGHLTRGAKTKHPERRRPTPAPRTPHPAPRCPANTRGTPRVTLLDAMLSESAGWKSTSTNQTWLFLQSISHA